MTQARISNDSNNITPMPARSPQQVSELLDKATLCARLNISARTVENMVKDGSFPPPVRVGKYVYWSEVAVPRVATQALRSTRGLDGALIHHH